jgi:hypothetical protein
MKTPLLLCALFPTALMGGELPVAFLPEKKFDLLPPLALADAARAKSPEVLNEAKSFFYRATPRTPSVAKPLSQMPILVPKDDVNWRLRILAPDPTVDYKLIIRDPVSGPTPAK